jgi:hypothetical protein
MNMAEGARLRQLEALVESLKSQVADLVRRVDDLSNAERARTEREARKKVG